MTRGPSPFGICMVALLALNAVPALAASAEESESRLTVADLAAYRAALSRLF